MQYSRANESYCQSCEKFRLFDSSRDLLDHNLNYVNTKIISKMQDNYFILFKQIIITEGMKNFKNQSISLVKLNPQTNQLFVTTEAIKYLSSLTRPIAIITIAGLYRTGKSFLVNKLLPSNYGTQHESAFKVGTTTQSMTKGLNILATPITLQCPETSEQIDYLLIDSEGIGSCEQSTKYDMDLLILIFLISSTVVYNSMGAIDQQSLQQLQVVLKLKNCVDNTEHEYDQCYYKYSSPPPKFCWILRDFALQLTDKNGKEISSDQYLQQCLEQSSNTTNPQIKKKNEIRRAIKQNLGERHCYTLVRPTIREQDLQHLSSLKNQQSSKIRTQFIGQLQCLKQWLFSGSIDDIKKINNQPMTGKLFSRILCEYISIINRNQLPKVKDVWNSVLKINNEEFFEQLMSQLKREVKTIKLPMSKQQLKLKINQIQNRIYKNLEKTIESQSDFKSYHKQFLKVIQKLNKQMKEKNDELKKNNLLSQLHQFVKQNLNYETIKPHNIAEMMKQFVERIKVRINGVQEGYQYLIGILNDVFFIIEQKCSKTERQLTEIKSLYENLNLDKNNIDLTLMNLKREYHESLKTIAKMQLGQADIDKNYTLTQNKMMNYQTKIIKLESDLKHDKQIYERTIKQLQQKSKSRIEELTNDLRKTKQANTKLEEQIMRIKDKLNEQDLISRKETIFQEKIKESFDKFNEQRNILKKQIQTYKKQVTSVNQKYIELKQTHEKQCEKQKSIEQNYEKKEKNFLKQFENLKQCIKETKASYQQTSKTMISSEQVLKQVTNYASMSTAKKDKMQTPCPEGKIDYLESNAENKAIMKKYYETQIQKLTEQHQMEISRLEQKIKSLQNELEKQEADKQTYYLEAKQYKTKCMKLEGDIISANSKFNQFLKQIEEAKHKQRTLYEQSIVRLLNNIDRRQRESSSNSVTEERISSTSSNINRRTRNTQYNHGNIKESVSFGNMFKTG